MKNRELAEIDLPNQSFGRTCSLRKIRTFLDVKALGKFAGDQICGPPEYCLPEGAHLVRQKAANYCKEVVSQAKKMRVGRSRV